MGRAPCCDKTKVKRGPWSADEDAKLKSYIQQHGTGGNWIALPQKIGLKRCGKSCRLRWLNYLRPNIKHGGFSDEEDNVICTLYMAIGSRWSIIAAQLPGRTDNDIKNYWNTKLKKKLLNKQHKEIQEAARRSNTTYNNGVNSNYIIIKREDYIAAQVTTTCDQSPYWPQYQLPSMPIYPSSSQQQQDNIMTNYPENISIWTINNAFDQNQLYENFDIPSITSLSPVNNITTCFQLPNSNGFQDFNNFMINEMDDSTVFIDSMEKTSGLGSGGVEMVNSINGTTSASGESTVSWGGDSLNSNLVCSPMVSMISYEDIPQEMQCGFGDQHHYFGFHQ